MGLARTVDAFAKTRADSAWRAESSFCGLQQNYLPFFAVFFAGFFAGFFAIGVTSVFGF
jgi:hypothetical protein